MAYWLSRKLGIVPPGVNSRQAIRSQFNNAPDNYSEPGVNTEAASQSHLSEQTDLVTQVGKTATAATLAAGAVLQKFL